MVNNTMPKLLLLLIVFSLGLSGCTKAPTISADTMFMGYPCGDRCAQFRAGFELARDRKYTKEDQCQTIAEENQLGCLSFIHEYKVENELPPYYTFNTK